MQEYQGDIKMRAIFVLLAMMLISTQVIASPSSDLVSQLDGSINQLLDVTVTGAVGTSAIKGEFTFDVKVNRKLEVSNAMVWLNSTKVRDDESGIGFYDLRQVGSADYFYLEVEGKGKSDNVGFKWVFGSFLTSYNPTEFDEAGVHLEIVGLPDMDFTMGNGKIVITPVPKAPVKKKLTTTWGAIKFRSTSPRPTAAR